MRKILLLSVLFLLPFALFAQEAKEGQTENAAPAEAQQNNVADIKTPIVKKVVFNPGRRNPFLSQEEVVAIEQKRKAELRRLEQENAERIRQAQRAKEEAIRRQIEEEENRRYPARKIMNKINVEGILGTEAIINGEIVGVGAKVLGAKIVSITDDSVWFVFEGQRFQRKLPLM